jgi:chloride channel protein, CIC family
MGALFAGIIRAPMTSVFMVFEITQDYQILVPLMVANLLSFTISRRYQPTPIYHALLEQDHVHLPSGGGRRTTRIRARDVMSRDPMCIAPDRPIRDVWEATRAQPAVAWIVGSRDHFLGCVSADQLAEAAQADESDRPVIDLVVEGWPTVYADDTLDLVVERLGRTAGLLPVLSRLDGRRLEGAITPERIVQLIQPSRATVRRARVAEVEVPAAPER